MVSASLQKNQGKKEKEVIQRPAVPKATEGTTFKELAPEIWFETKVLGRSVAALSEIVIQENTAAFLW